MVVVGYNFLKNKYMPPIIHNLNVRVATRFKIIWNFDLILRLIVDQEMSFSHLFEVIYYRFETDRRISSISKRIQKLPPSCMQFGTEGAGTQIF